MAESEILDLLFDENEGLLNLTENQDTVDNLVKMDEFNEYTDDIMELLNNTDNLAELACEATEDLIFENGHLPMLSPSHSDSGISSDEPASPLSNDYWMSASPELSPGITLNEFFLGDNNTLNWDEDSADLIKDFDIGSDSKETDIDINSSIDFNTVDSSVLQQDDVANEIVLDSENVTIDVGQLQTITIDASQLKGHKHQTIKIVHMSKGLSSLPYTIENVQYKTHEKPYELYQLTEEEKRIMLKDGISLPTNAPLTKEEERQLKGIRRKIRNKESAKNSRRKKEAYVDGLEDRVKICSQQNVQLQKKINTLEKQNTSMLGQLRRLQALVSQSGAKQTTAGTCLMVLMVSFALLVVPSYNPWSDPSNSEAALVMPMAGRSRSLLHTDESDDPYTISRHTTDPSQGHSPANTNVHGRAAFYTSQNDQSLQSEYEKNSQTGDIDQFSLLDNYESKGYSKTSLEEPVVVINDVNNASVTNPDVVTATDYVETVLVTEQNSTSANI